MAFGEVLTRVGILYLRSRRVMTVGALVPPQLVTA
jgi:hypothetical protein